MYHNSGILIDDIYIFFQMQDNDRCVIDLFLIQLTSPELSISIYFRINLPSVLLGAFEQKFRALINDNAIVDRVSQRSSWCKCISSPSIGDRSLQQEPTKYKQLWTIFATRYDFLYHAVRGVSCTCNKQCRSCTQWNRNVKNRSNKKQQSASVEPCLEILLLKASMPPSTTAKYVTIKSRSLNDSH